jgi:hypothetical protein
MLKNFLRRGVPLMTIATLYTRHTLWLRMEKKRPTERSRRMKVMYTAYTTCTLPVLTK